MASPLSSLPVVGLYGSLGSGLGFAQVTNTLNGIIEVINKDSEKVPAYIVTRKPEAVPDGWKNAFVIPEDWLRDMMEERVWIQPDTPYSRKRKTGHIPIDRDPRSLPAPSEAIGSNQEQEEEQKRQQEEEQKRQQEEQQKRQQNGQQNGQRNQEGTRADESSQGNESGQTIIKQELDADGNGSGSSDGAKAEAERKSAEEHARAALERSHQAQEEAIKAVEAARVLGVNTAGFDNHSPMESSSLFKIPAHLREENVEGSGEIMYSTDKGYLLVYEKFKGLYRAYMISGSQYPMEKKAFIDRKGPRLDAQIVTSGARRDDVNIFEIEIEAIAVLWRGERVQRALITLRESKNSELLLYNITSMRARWGEANTTLRLYYEFLMREQEPAWFPAQKRRVSRHHNAELKFLRANQTAINRGKKAVQILKVEDNENELELAEERLNPIE